MNTNLFPDRSPCLTRHDLPCILSPNTWRALSSLLCCPPSVTGFPDTFCQYPGLDFTLNPQARRYARPNRVPHRTDCMFASGCSPPRLTATQLPSATGSGHLPEGDFHPSDRACSQAHGFRLEACRNDDGVLRKTFMVHCDARSWRSARMTQCDSGELFGHALRVRLVPQRTTVQGDGQRKTSREGREKRDARGDPESARLG